MKTLRLHRSPVRLSLNATGRARAQVAALRGANGLYWRAISEGFDLGEVDR